MIKWILSLVFLVFGVVLIAQQGNPFDIQERLIEEESKAKSTKEQNIFDVDRQHTSENISRSEVQVDSIPTTPMEAEQLPVNIEDDNNIEYISNGENPFEVDHVPIRKRKISQVERKSRKGVPVSLVDSRSESNLFIFWLSLLSLLLLAIVLNTQRGTLLKLFKSLTNENILKLNNREEKGGTSGSYYILYIVYFVNIASFLYLGLKYYSHIEAGFLQWLYIFLGVFGLYMTRHIAMFILGTFFPVEKESKLYNFTIIVFNLSLGIFLIPVNLLLAFGPEGIINGVLYFALVIIGILLLLRILRGFFISIPYLTSNTFHFLLYLCAFEISPILLILKSIF